jgi:hypothetical protein
LIIDDVVKRCLDLVFEVSISFIKEQGFERMFYTNEEVEFIIYERMIIVGIETIK